MTIHEQHAPDSRQRKCYEERQGQVRGGEAAGRQGFVLCEVVRGGLTQGGI